MAEKTYPMTLAEKEQLEQELEELKLVRRPEVVERIKIARSYGDLSENSEYDAAKDEQAFVEGQIQILETKIRYAEIIDSDAVAKDEVAIGKTVTVEEVGTTDKDVYHIVGAAGADIFSGRISNESPIAQALIGKKQVILLLSNHLQEATTLKSLVLKKQLNKVRAPQRAFRM